MMATRVQNAFVSDMCMSRYLRNGRGDDVPIEFKKGRKVPRNEIHGLAVANQRVIHAAVWGAEDEMAAMVIACKEQNRGDRNASSAW